MIDAAWALLAVTVTVGIGDLCNRHVVGWLPDDPPRPGRKQHARPMPMAGVLVVPAMLPWCLAEAAWLPSLAIVLAATVGFVDDRRKERDDGLDWRLKAAGLAVAAGLIATACTAGPGWPEPLAWSIAFALTFVLTNAYNFLDNTDGVTASLAATSLLCLGLGYAAGSYAVDGWVVAAGFTALGFLPWNWPRPRVFLGDAGAYALGIAVSYAAVRSLQVEAASLLAIAVPLVDFTQVILARLALGRPPWVGDRRHLTHIVQNAGLPRWLVAPLFATVAWLVATGSATLWW